MGDLKIHGLDSKATARLENDWTLRPGDVYDSSYPGRFVEQAYKEIGDWNTSVHESVDEKEKQWMSQSASIRGHRPRSNFGRYDRLNLRLWRGRRIVNASRVRG